jgi:hypothetical protein
MSPPPAVFDRGRPSACLSSPSHCPSDQFNQSIFNRHHNIQPATTVFVLPTTGPASPLTTLPPVGILRTASVRFILPPTTVATTKRLKIRPSLLYEWLPPPCRTSCFFSVGSLLVFPETSIVLPITLLEKHLPYVYVCACSSDKQPSSLSHSSITVDHVAPRQFHGTMFGLEFSSSITNPLAPAANHNLPVNPTFAPTPEADTNKPPLPILHRPNTADHDMPRRFNGIMFGQVLSSPISQTIAPTIVHHLPDITTFPPTPVTGGFPDAVETLSALPQCSTIISHTLPHHFIGTMFGQNYFSAVAATPDPVPPPPPPVAIATLPIDPFPTTVPHSVAASSPAPSTLSDFSGLSLPSSIPWFPTIFCTMYPKPAILERPPPKPPHPYSLRHNFTNPLLSYKLLGRVN